MRGAQSSALGVELEAVLADVGDPVDADDLARPLARAAAHARDERVRAASRSSSRRVGSGTAESAGSSTIGASVPSTSRKSAARAGFGGELMQGVHGRSLAAKPSPMPGAYCPGCREGSSSRSDWWSPRRSVWVPASPGPPPTRPPRSPTTARAVAIRVLVPGAAGSGHDARHRAARRDAVRDRRRTPTRPTAGRRPRPRRTLRRPPTPARHGDEQRHGPRALRRRDHCRLRPRPRERRVDRDDRRRQLRRDAGAEPRRRSARRSTGESDGARRLGDADANVAERRARNAKVAHYAGSVAAIDIRLNARPRRSPRRQRDPDRLRRGALHSLPPAAPKPETKATTTTTTTTEATTTRRRPRPRRQATTTAEADDDPVQAEAGDQADDDGARAGARGHEPPPPPQPPPGPLPVPARALAGARRRPVRLPDLRQGRLRQHVRRDPRATSATTTATTSSASSASRSSRSPTGRSSRSAGTRSAATASGCATGRATPSTTRTSRRSRRSCSTARA